MLTATSHSSYGDSRILTALILERRFRAFLMWRHRLLYDSRLAVPARRPRDVATIYLSLEGTIETRIGVTSSPTAFALHANEYEHATPGGAWFRSWGDPAVVLSLQFETGDVRVPIGLEHGPLSIAPATWSALAALAEATGQAADVQPPMLALIRGLVDDGVIAPAVADGIRTESLVVQRLWRALEPYYQRFSTGVTKDSLVRSGKGSARQIARDVREFDASLPVFGGFRDTLLLLRLRLAVLLLSHPEASVAEVAGWVGYTSVDSLTGAFADAGLPAPSTLREQLRYPGST